MVGLTLLILTAFILFSYTDLWAKTLSTQHKNEISLWVSTTAAKLSATGGHLQETGSPPVSSLYEKPIQITKEEDFQKDANRIIAQAMLNCWESFGSGEIAFLGSNYDGVDKIFCFPCAQIKFSEEIKNKYTDLEEIEFRNYLSKPIAKNGPTYIELFKGNLALDTEIKKESNMYIIFIAGKGGFWERIQKSYVAFMPFLAPGTRYFKSNLCRKPPRIVQAY